MLLVILNATQKCIYDDKRGNLWAALDNGVLVIEDIFGVASPQSINVEFGATSIGTIVLDVAHDLVRAKICFRY